MQSTKNLKYGAAQESRYLKNNFYKTKAILILFFDFLKPSVHSVFTNLSSEHNCKDLKHQIYN